MPYHGPLPSPGTASSGGMTLDQRTRAPFKKMWVKTRPWRALQEALEIIIEGCSRAVKQDHLAIFPTARWYSMRFGSAACGKNLGVLPDASMVESWRSGSYCCALLSSARCSLPAPLGPEDQGERRGSPPFGRRMYRYIRPPQVPSGLPYPLPAGDTPDPLRMKGNFSMRLVAATSLAASDRASEPGPLLVGPGGLSMQGQTPEVYSAKRCTGAGRSPA